MRLHRLPGPALVVLLALRTALAADAPPPAPAAPEAAPAAPAGPAAPTAPVGPARPEVPDPAPWLDASGASLAGVSRDGSVVLLRMSRDGVTQAFRLGRDGGWPRRLTFRGEGVDFVRLSPDGRRMVLGYDRRGDENHGLFLRSTDPDDPTERVLSDAPGVQHGDVTWSEDGERVFFRSNEADRADFHLYEMTVATGAVRCVLARPGMWSIHDADREGKRLLVGLTKSVQERSIHVLDLATGDLKEIDPPAEGRIASPDDATFVGRGDEVAFLSDRGGEWCRPWIARLADGAVRPIEAPPDVDVDALHVARDGGTIWLVLNVGGRGRLHARDARTGAERPVPTTGDALVGGFATDAKGTLFFDLTRADTPGTVLRWDGAGSAAVPLTYPDLAGLPPAAYRVEPRFVTYPTFDGRRIPAWLYLPPDREAKRLPFVLSIHGGPTGQARPGFSGERAYLLSLGFGVLAPDVRGSTGYGRTYRDLDDYKGRLDSVRDAKAAADWLVAEGLADARRLAVTGGSYGGYMVLALLTEHPDLFAAGAESVGIANFETFLERTAPYRRANRESEYGPLTDREFLRSISPIHKADRIRAPLLISHGENDPRVPVSEARQIETAIRSRGGVVEALYWKDEGHGLSQRRNRRTHLQRLAAFLVRHLGRP